MPTLLRCNLYLICLVLFGLSLASHSAPREEVLFKKDAAAMRLIPAATYTIGSESEIADVDETPAHPVKLADFYIDKYEVTQKQWEDVMVIKINVHQTPHHGADLPVDFIKWEEAVEYCYKLGKRLPTEAEWLSLIHI